jgi:hypothetical protein
MKRSGIYSYRMLLLRSAGAFRVEKRRSHASSPLEDPILLACFGPRFQSKRGSLLRSAKLLLHAGRATGSDFRRGMEALEKRGR